MTGHPLDLPAMAAYGAFAEVFPADMLPAQWEGLPPKGRELWRAIADVVLMMNGLHQPAGEAEVTRLRQILWDIYAACGEDTDGDRRAPKPGVMTPDVPELALEAVRELRRDSEAEAAQLEQNWRGDRDKLVAIREAAMLAPESRLTSRVLGILDGAP